MNKKAIRNLTNEWLKVKYEQFSLEPQYSFIEPKLFAEFFRPKTKIFRGDYQVHCINEIPFMIEVVHVKEKQAAYQFYDTNWKLLPFGYKNSQSDDIEQKPDFFDQMIEYAKIL